MTGSVITLAALGKSNVNKLADLLPLAPATDSLTAVDVIMPKPVVLTKNDLVERPMFWSTRRPYVAPPPKVKTKKKVVKEKKELDPFETIKLIGVYSGGAMVQVDGVLQRIHPGETLEGLDWSLEVMDKNMVMFILGEEHKILELEHAMVKAPKKARKVTNTKKETKKRDKSNNTKENKTEADKEPAINQPDKNKAITKGTAPAANKK